MVFFCFSSKDRLQIVESMLFHITNYEVDVWYDRHKMLMGDERDYKNFEEGVNSCEYAIVILSPNAVESICVREEIELIHKRYRDGHIIVFPVFYNLSANELSSEFQWMTKLVYKEFRVDLDSHSACNHIICKILLDELEKYKVKSINDFLKIYEKKPTFNYMSKILRAYSRTSDDNRDAQISLLYAICVYFKETYSLIDVPTFYYTGIDRLFDETRLHLPIDLRETLIFERLTLLLANVVLFGYIP